MVDGDMNLEMVLDRVSHRTMTQIVRRKCFSPPLYRSGAGSPFYGDLEREPVNCNYSF